MAQLKLQKTELSGVTVRLVEAQDARPAVHLLLCHGYGAGGDDLVGLAAELLMSKPELAQVVRCVLPEAPLDLAAQGMPGGRAWWHLDMMQLMSRRPEDLETRRNQVPPGLPEAREKVEWVLAELEVATGIGLERTLFAGFSQGSMLATDLALRGEGGPAALAVLSGAPVSAKEWIELARTKPDLPIFQSHGRQDAILPYAWGESMRDLFQEAGLQVDFHPFEGPHGIPGEIARALADWLVVQLERMAGRVSTR